MALTWDQVKADRTVMPFNFINQHFPVEALDLAKATCPRVVLVSDGGTRVVFECASFDQPATPLFDGPLLDQQLRQVFQNQFVFEGGSCGGRLVQISSNLIPSCSPVPCVDSNSDQCTLKASVTCDSAPAAVPLGWFSQSIYANDGCVGLTSRTSMPSGSCFRLGCVGSSFIACGGTEAILSSSSDLSCSTTVSSSNIPLDLCLGRLFVLCGTPDTQTTAESTIAGTLSLASLTLTTIPPSTASLAPITLPPSPFDLNGDGSIESSDVLFLLATWGACNSTCAGDFDHDGVVGILDVALLLDAVSNTTTSH